MTAPPLRWEPDKLAAAAVLTMPKSFVALTDMSLMDRCWLVAELTAAGLTAEDIAERTSCSRRLVMSVRAEPVTIVLLAARAETVEAEGDMRAERSVHHVTAGLLSDANRSIERLRGQLDQLLDKLVTDGRLEALPCGHPRVRYRCLCG